ncbi:MAG: hypothetical protein KID00_01810 [Clostridium argentinense]|uniref:Uncharacterized protein n=1 Tax=Clostridium faecium TaxID=2762223 RepID=A0ABR8YP50_9CLOT|nr:MULTISPECIES: hypothetical protein [Clostridium]MBD8045791.1 hypothetical protein [Clostridium faecium]MBS5822593.1 hypothetical protein [Clostridium argentinense]MDU1347842.1 hypothetical protein [Clostridium argentinense]
MSIYEAPSQELMTKLKSYKKIGESIKVSKPAMLHDNLFREVVFSKKIFKKFSSEPECYMYIDENNNIIEDKFLCERLGRLFYYMDIYLNEEPGSVLSALQDEGEITKDKNDYERVIRGLEVIKKKEPENIDNVIEVIKKLPSLRNKNNEKLKVLKEAIEEQKLKHETFNEAMVEALHPYYRDALAVNYEKILLIGKGSKFYGDIKRKSEKRRRTSKFFLSTKHTDPLLKVHYTMGYFQNLLKVYGNVVDMSYNQYMKLVDNAGRRMAEEKMLHIRK